MLAQNGTSHQVATKVIDPPKKEQNLTKAQNSTKEEVEYLEQVVIPYLEKQLTQAQQKTEKLKKAD